MDQQQREEIDSRLAGSHGIAFQEAVVAILRAAVDPAVWTSPPYRPDGGCDAYIPSWKAVAQIHGPLSAVSQEQICTKLQEDARKLLESWVPSQGEIERFYFIINLPEVPFSVQQAAMNALPGVQGSALGRNNLLAFLATLAPLEIEHRLGVPAFNLTQDRETVAKFLAMVNEHSGGVDNLCAGRDFPAAAYRAVGNGVIEQGMADGGNPVMSRDRAVWTVQVQLANGIRNVMRACADVPAIHTDYKDPASTEPRMIQRLPLQPFDFDGRAAHRQFDAQVQPLRQQLRQNYEFLKSYANQPPPGLTRTPLPFAKWNSGFSR